MTYPHFYTASILTLLLFASNGCGWGTASRVYDQKPEPKPEPEVVFVQGTNGTPTKTPPKTPMASVASTQNDDPCPAKFFTVFRMEATRKQTKEVFCSNGQTANLNQTAITEDTFRRERLNNIPEGAWYLLVDPNKTTPAGTMTLTNEQLLKLSKLYTIKYHNKMQNTGQIIYILASDTPKR